MNLETCEDSRHMYAHVTYVLEKACPLCDALDKIVELERELAQAEKDSIGLEEEIRRLSDDISDLTADKRELEEQLEQLEGLRLAERMEEDDDD